MERQIAQTTENNQLTIYDRIRLNAPYGMRTGAALLACTVLDSSRTRSLA
jgi:hypothetical protein